MTERATLSGAVLGLALAINVDEVGTLAHRQAVADGVSRLGEFLSVKDDPSALDCMAGCLASGAACWIAEGARPGPNFERLRGLSDWALRVVAGSRRQEGGA